MEIRAKANILFSRAEDYFSVPATQFRKKTAPFQPVLNTLHDQKQIWTSPLRTRKADLSWLLPLGATMGLLIATDRHEMSLMHTNARNRERSALISDAGVGAFAGASAIAYGLGALTHNDHARETGRLTGEALIDSLIVSEGLKFISMRQRPREGNGRGLFGRSSLLDSSFPSTHSTLAWSAATIFAQEYPGPLTKWTAYGLASLVSISRITAEQHFPSDVLAGAAAGYLIGKLVYKLHHDDRLNDRTGATAVKVPEPAGSLPSLAASHSAPVEKNGSPYVPLDSWVYPALKRLAALGYIRTQVSDMGPWTRAECFRQTQEAADAASSRSVASGHAAQNEEALKLISDLVQELKPVQGATAVALESIYTRFTGISGTPLRDSYHFGQTIVNDYGRPYDRGLNNVTGLSGYATSGPFFAYFRGEYQHAPGREPLPLNVRQFIANADVNPLQGPVPVAETNRFKPLEMYAGVKLGFENITFGKQSLWWGPGEASAFSFSNNAEPIYMLRLAQDRPLILPGILSKLGKIRTEVIFGKLSGHRWPARPYVNAQKVSFNLTDNFELGFTRSAFFGGVGHPLTFGNIAASLVSTRSTGTAAYGDQTDPGDRHSGFDFRYRIPGLRRFVTVYSDSFADDDPNPLDNPRRSAWAPGLYLSQIPGLEHFDFRFETYSTWLYSQDFGGNFLYWNTVYRDSYTNKDYLLGSWIGRDSRAYLASTTYWFSARSTVQASYRQIKGGTAFLPGGGTQTDAAVRAQWGVTPEWTITAAAQYERYYVPVLGQPKRNFLSSIQVTFTPHR